MIQLWSESDTTPGAFLTKCLKVVVKMQTESGGASSQADWLMKHLSDPGATVLSITKGAE